MDTKEKNRPADPKQEGRKRPRRGETAPERREARKREDPERRSQEQRKQRPTAEQRRQRPAAAGQERPQRAAAQAPARENRPQRPARQPIARSARAREEGVVYSAPQGTGPRKSAPKMSPEEMSELRRQQRARKPAPQPEKKNALQNLISGVKGGQNLPEDPAARAELRRKQRAQREEKKRKQAIRYDTPAVIYTEPVAFNRDRFLIHILSVVAVVAAMVIGMSVFFKVETITVAGAETYSTWAVREASGIKEGDNLLTFSKARAIAKVHAELSYVDNVRIGIKLPDTVIIYIEELDVAYAVEAVQGDWWLINSEGRVVEQITAGQAASYTKVLGVTLEEPQVGAQAVAANEIPQETLESGEAVPITVTGVQRLTSALQILKALEANDIVGQAASVDVTELENIVLWYGSRYEVLLGDNTRMEHKIACMNDAILELSEYQSGILDVSFTTWQTQVGYTPFG